MRTLCAGHVNWDVTLHVERLPEPDGETPIERRVQAGGGSAANVAAGLSGLSVDAALLGSVGTDASGRLAVGELRTAGVDCSNVREAEGETAVKYLVVDREGEVMVLASEGENEAFSADDLAPGALERVDHLHLTSQRPGTAATLAERAATAGVTVSFDPGRRIEERDYAEAIARTDLLLVNEREAAALERTGFSIESLVEEGRVVVTKRGAAGARIDSPDGVFEHPGYGVDVVDTTGAGDAFASGFIAAGGEGYERALSVANACGALAVGVHGARADLSWEAVDALAGG